MRREGLVAVVIILVMASLGVGYLSGNSTRKTETLTSTSTSTEFSTVTGGKTMTSTTTSTLLIGQPIPVASIETWNVTVGGDPSSIALNPKTDTLYITNLFSSNLTVLMEQSLSVVARIKLPSMPSGIAVDDTTNMVYASVSGGIEEINGSTNKVAGELRLGVGGPLAIDSSTHIIYGATGNEALSQGIPPYDALAGVDVLTGSVVANVSVGYPVNSVAVNPETHMVYAAGCHAEGIVCNSKVSIVNGTSESLVTTVNLGDYDYPELAANPATNVVYVSGARLVALNGSNGNVIFSVNPLECGPFINMAVIPYLNEVAAAPQDYNYVLVYNGTTGALLNMYSISNGPESVAFNPGSDELYATVSGEYRAQVLSFPNAATIGSADSALMSSGQNCPLP